MKEETEATKAAKRFAVLRPYLDGKVSLTEVAAVAGVSLRTARRWISHVRESGPAALERKRRSDAGERHLPEDLIALIEGYALTPPRVPVAVIRRRVSAVAAERGWPVPSYASVHAVVSQITPAMMTLAHEDAVAFRDRYELVHRHCASRSNARWQADHTQLDIMILEANGAPVRPWLTTIIDDYSRAVAGYMVFIGAPSILNTSLALRQAIWRKTQTHWPVCGIPDVLHVDHGSDFTSIHLNQAAADLRIQMVYSIVARPQGRGKVERLFGTLNTELLPELPGYIQNGKSATSPKLSLSELDTAIGDFLVDEYNQRLHSGIGAVPIEAWRADGWIPRLPDSQEALDSLLIRVAKPRIVRRDGIHFQGLHFLDPTLAAYVGESVTIRYDPRDIGEVRVFYRNVFLCRAVSPEHASQKISLKDIQAARSAYRRRLRSTVKERRGRVADLLPSPSQATPAPKPEKTTAAKPRLRTYAEEG